MNQAKPFISIIVPTYGRSQKLIGCLYALAEQDYPKERFEIIVVDDGGRAPLDAIVNPFQARADVRLITRAHAGPAAARNAGADQAVGDFLAFTDDDCRPATDWLTVVSRGLMEWPAGAIGGRTLNALTNNLYAEASQMLVHYLYHYFAANDQAPNFFTSNNMALARTQFLALGGFSESFPVAGGEDRDFSDRWQYSGYKLHFVAEAMVYHTHRMGMGTFMRQHFNYGRGSYLFRRARSRRHQRKMKFEPIAFYLNLVRFPWREEPVRRAIPLSLLLALCQICTVAGYAWQRQTAQNYAPAPPEERQRLTVDLGSS